MMALGWISDIGGIIPQPFEFEITNSRHPNHLRVVWGRERHLLFRIFARLHDAVLTRMCHPFSIVILFNIAYFIASYNNENISHPEVFTGENVVADGTHNQGKIENF